MANFYGDDIDDLQLGGFVDYYGGTGADSLEGNEVTNQIYGGAGNCSAHRRCLVYDYGNGTVGTPWFYTGFYPSGDDYIEGGSGDDTIYGGDGNDALYGGDDDFGAALSTLGPVLLACRPLRRRRGYDYLDGGRGNDSSGNTDDPCWSARETTLSWVAPALDGLPTAVQARTRSAAKTEMTSLTGAPRRRINGGQGADRTVGDDGNDIIYGGTAAGDGGDFIDGGGADQISGGDGADVIYGGEGGTLSTARAAMIRSPGTTETISFYGDDPAGPAGNDLIAVARATT